jgi:histidyl-tRNA synthetase
VLEGLAAVGIEHEVDPRLVRGLDYYTHTLFEFQSQALDSAQSTIVGGGRYNGLAEALGGPETPGIGFGSGVERVLLHLDAEDAFPAPGPTTDVFLVDATDGHHARDLAELLRDEGLRVDRAFDGRSMKAQMKGANRSGAAAAVIVGQDEAATETVTVRDLRAGQGQTTIPRDQLASHLHTLLSEESPT